MRVTVTEQEWREAVARAREVGAAMGAERAGVVAARAAVEALGVTVPVLTDEMDTGPAPAVQRPRTAGPANGSEPPERPRTDLRLAARSSTPTDGYCAHCTTVYGSEALAQMDDGNRLCPVHGTVINDVTEVAEGRYRTHKPRGVPRGIAVTRERCGAPVGGHPCALDAGHEGRHDPRQVSA